MIMILAVEMLLMKRTKAAPERMDLFPILCESNLNVASFPPIEEHVVRRISRM